MTTAYSRPFRSLTVLLMIWVAIRAVALWSGVSPQKDLDAKPAAFQTAKRGQVRPATPFATRQYVVPQVSRRVSLTLTARPMSIIRSRFSPGTGTVRATLNSQRIQATVVETNIGAQKAAFVVPPIPVSVEDAGAEQGDARSRWSASAWLLARREGPAALGAAGQLGGSQVGMRAYFEVDRPIAATLRISRTLSRAQGGEASVGVALRHRNSGLLLERRVALDRGGRNDFAATAYGGFDDIAVGSDLRLDGYMQAGLVGKDKFADGALRIERTVATVQQARISVGTGLWGGAQPNVARLDIGPQIVARVPVEGRTMRLSADWRERIMGGAAPDSGPSITIGIDL